MIHKSLFLFAHQIGDRNFYPTYKKLVQNQWKSYEQLKEEQEKQLRVMINFAYKNVPYYHKLFNDLKLSPEDIKKGRRFREAPYTNERNYKTELGGFKTC